MSPGASKNTKNLEFEPTKHMNMAQLPRGALKSANSRQPEYRSNKREPPGQVAVLWLLRPGRLQCFKDRLNAYEGMCIYLPKLGFDAGFEENMSRWMQHNQLLQRPLDVKPLNAPNIINRTVRARHHRWQYACAEMALNLIAKCN